MGLRPVSGKIRVDLAAQTQLPHAHRAGYAVGVVCRLDREGRR